MENVLEKDSYKMSYEERESITKKLDEAISNNEKKPQTKVWNSKEYREKYAL